IAIRWRIVRVGVVTTVRITTPRRVRVKSGGYAVTPRRVGPAGIVTVGRVGGSAVIIAGVATIIVAITARAAVVTRPVVLPARIRAGSSVTRSAIVARATHARTTVLIVPHHLRGMRSYSCRLGL